MPSPAGPEARPVRPARSGLAPYLFAVPAGLGLVVLVAGPVAGVVLMSFTNWQLGAREAQLVGVANYLDLFADPLFRRSLANTLIYVLLVAPATFALALAVALAIESGRRFKAWYRTLIFLPVTATVVAMAVVWDFILHPTVGPLNAGLALMGLEGRNWLRDPATALPVLAVIGIWLKLGYLMVLFLAGLAKIPRTYYEAAAMDGVRSAWDRFRYVTWPLLGPTSLFAAIIVTVQSFETFETVAVLTEGGPNHATEVLLHTLYVEGFRFFRTGYAAALTVVFLVIILSLTAANMASLRGRVTAHA